VARIVPIQPTRDEQEAQMVADGLLTLPKQEMDWEAFWAMPRPNVPKDVAVQALIDSRGDR
jgi:antitoxin (DNA-binding transcriptional repressor) of toxin-antitoxin stability system